VPDQQEIALKFTAQTEAVQLAEKRAAALKAELASLQSQVQRGAPGWELAQREIAGVTKELLKAEKAAQQAKGALDRVAKPGGPRLDANKQAQLGFGLANLAQDLAYGPQAGVNNLVFMAQQSGGIKELGKDAAAFGVTAAAAFKGIPALIAANAAPLAMVGGALGVVTLAAYALDKGLKDAGLGWSDFTTVLGNLAPVEAAGNAVVGTWEVLKDSAVGSAVDAVWGSLKNIVHETANVAVGWDDATEATRRHKEELAAVEANVKRIAEAEKELQGVRSKEQKEAADRGTKFAQAAADLGGKGGLDEVAQKVGALGMSEAGGAPITKEEFKALLNDARKGDVEAQNKVTALTKMAGYDVTGMKDAQVGRDREKEQADAEKTQADRDRETALLNEEGRKNEEAMRREQADAAKADEQAKKQQADKDEREREQRLSQAPSEARRSIGALDTRVQQALMLGQVGGGSERVVGEAVAKAVSDALQAKGMGKAEAEAAGKSIVEDNQAQLRDQVSELALKSEQLQQQRRGPQTFAASDFTRSVQDGQDTQKEIRDINKAMLDKLAAIERGGVGGRLAR
jgi:hypothetical protein